MLRPSICITDIMSYFLQGNLAGQEELPAGKIIFFLKITILMTWLYHFYCISNNFTEKKLLNFMGILSDQHHLSFLYEMSLFYCLLHVMQHGSGLLLCAVNE